MKSNLGGFFGGFLGSLRFGDLEVNWVGVGRGFARKLKREEAIMVWGALGVFFSGIIDVFHIVFFSTILIFFFFFFRPPFWGGGFFLLFVVGGKGGGGGARGGWGKLLGFLKGRGVVGFFACRGVVGYFFLWGVVLLRPAGFFFPPTRFLASGQNLGPPYPLWLRGAGVPGFGRGALGFLVVICCGFPFFLNESPF